MVFFQNNIGGQEGFIIARRRAEFFGDIGRDNGEIGARNRIHQEGQAVVEFMVAQGGGVIAKGVHGVHGVNDGVGIALFHAAGIGDVVAHRVALQEVAIVEEDGIGGLGADALDKAGGARQANGINGFVGVIVIGENMDMQVGGFHDAQMGLIGGSIGRERVQGDEACGAADETAT